jgi:aminoglycoside 3-N-acetyltransferase I
VIALVAIEGEAVVGGLVAYELDKLEQARREVYIYDLAVLESRRRRGVATGLIERLRAIAAERGAWVVYVQATTATSRRSRSTPSWGRART